MNTNQHNFNLNVFQAWKLWSEERPLELVDESLGDSVIQAQVLRCIHMGLLCVQERPEDRPNMWSVIHTLNDDKPLARPRQPAFYPHQESSSSPKNNEMCSTNDISITLLEARQYILFPMQISCVSNLFHEAPEREFSCPSLCVYTI